MLKHDVEVDPDRPQRLGVLVREALARGAPPYDIAHPLRLQPSSTQHLGCDAGLGSEKASSTCSVPTKA